MPSWSNWDQVNAADPVDSVNVAAPGVNILSYYKFGLLANLSSTSMAAPHVAGALLIGGVQAGNLVTPFTPDTADPFAWAADFTGSNSGAPGAPSNQVIWGSIARKNSLMETVMTISLAYWRVASQGQAWDRAKLMCS